MAFDPETDPGWGLTPPDNPYQSSFAPGSGYVDDPSTPFDISGGSNLGTNAAAVAKALKDLQGGLQDANKPQSGASSPSGTPSGQAASGTGQGSPAGINALIQMLMQRSNAYFPGQPNRQPVALARPSGGGLLGI